MEEEEFPKCDPLLLPFSGGFAVETEGAVSRQNRGEPERGAQHHIA